MKERIYVAAEGVHDVAVVGTLLRLGGWKRLTKRTQLPCWRELLPTSWPQDENIARLSVQAPHYYQHGEKLLAIVAAGGISVIAPKLTTHLTVIASVDDPEVPTAVGVLLDQDTTNSPAARFDKLVGLLPPSLPKPSGVGLVEGAPRVGVYVLPGLAEQGTLEDVLLECAATSYPALGCRAVRYVDGVDQQLTEFRGRDLDDLRSPAGRNKAVIAAIAAVLRPGKSLSVSLEDNHWLEGIGASPRLDALRKFLAELLGTD